MRVTPDDLDFHRIHEHYKNCLSTSKKLRSFMKKGDAKNYVRLAIGIADLSGNYSASEHNLGPKILAETSNESVFSLAEQLNACQSALRIPELIYQAAIRYLKISVGSEMAMMLQPDQFWVANTRSVWAHFLVEYNFDYRAAKDVLLAYRETQTPEMNYSMWKKIYSDMRSNLSTLGKLGDEASMRAGLKTDGMIQYLWYDAIANELYDRFHK